MENGQNKIAGDPSTPETPSPLHLLGVDYWHVKTRAGGDLYTTQYGRPFLNHLMPENWLEARWFEQNREKLEGSSTVYRTRTRPLNGRSLEIVVKWCRVGEQVPFDTMTLNKFAQAEFNSPYEEFSCLMEMRDTRPGLIRTHKPLAIYVPPERLEVWQTGRSESTIAHKKAKHRDVELDICRQYILIYEWIKGVSAVEGLARTSLSKPQQSDILERLTLKVIQDLAVRGFRVIDTKPAHIIVRVNPDGYLLKDPAGNIAYALVDFELLERTPEYDQKVTHARRAVYLKRQRDRFGETASHAYPSHLQPVRIFGIDYVFGHTESTQGALWVVGKDPALFDYFLPERWRRTHKVKLSEGNDVFFTKTKDDINIVWKVSRMGERPDVNPQSPGASRALAYGYNSPFEEFTFALETSRHGISTAYPRAIYMTGLETKIVDYVEDKSRYESHANIRAPGGVSALSPNHNYITIWGFWNGVDEMLAAADRVYCEGINLRLATYTGYVSKTDHEALLDIERQRLLKIGLEDLNLKDDHILLSLDPRGLLIRDAEGIPEMRLCNFELVARIPSSP